jgi:hypothetical protein
LKKLKKERKMEEKNWWLRVSEYFDGEYVRSYKEVFFGTSAEVKEKFSWFAGYRIKSAAKIHEDGEDVYTEKNYLFRLASDGQKIREREMEETFWGSYGLEAAIKSYIRHQKKRREKF